MSPRRANRPVGLGGALIGLTLLVSSPAIAQNDSGPKVVGIPVTKDGKTVITDGKDVTIKLGDKITVKVAEQTAAAGKKAQTGAGDQSQPPGAAPATESGNASAAPADEAGKKPSSAPQESWLPGFSNEDALTKLVPFLNARPFKGIYPEAIDPQAHTVTFHLLITDKSKQAWADLLGRPGFDPRVISFSVGLEDQQQIPTDIKELKLEVFPKFWSWVAIVFFVLLLCLFFLLATRSTLLRDPGTSTGESPRFSDLFKPLAPGKLQLGPYSLARTQMAFWFFLVITAFVMIHLITGDTNSLTPGVLVLIGISAGTALGATAIDASKRPTTPNPPPGEPSRGWLTDILSDGENGISFHRFQIFVWTIVLGVVFFRAVFNSLTMPDFSTNLLTLMGISSGTYLGLKLPEQGAPEAPPEEKPDETKPEDTNQAEQPNKT